MAQRFAYIDYASVATITSSADATGFPKDNIRNASRWKKWRSSTTTGNQNIDIDFVSSKTLTFVAIVNPLGHTGGTIKAQWWNGAVFTDLGTFTLSTLTKLGVLWVNQATTKIRILFTNTGAVNSFVEVGTVFTGQYYEPVAQIQPGVGLQRVDPTEYSSSVDGQEFAQRRSAYYIFNGIYRPLQTTDRDTFITIYETVGRFKPFIYALIHTNMDRCIYGRFDQPMAINHINPSADLWSADVSITEVR